MVRGILGGTGVDTPGPDAEGRESLEGCAVGWCYLIRSSNKRGTLLAFGVSWTREKERGSLTIQISIGFPRKDGASERLADAIHTVNNGCRDSCCFQIALPRFPK